MSNSFMNFGKGLALGMAVGVASAMLVNPMDNKQLNKIQKKTKGVFRNIGDIIDTAVDLVH